MIDLPNLYDLHHQNYSEDLPFWISLVNNPDFPVLELGCGTGRVTQALASAGIHVVGVDNDLSMLLHLKRKETSLVKENIDVFRGDMSVFHLDIKFRLIIIPCNTYSTLTPQQRLATLQTIKRHSVSGANFVFSVPNPSLLLAINTDNEPELESVVRNVREDQHLQILSSIKKLDDYVEFTWYYDLLSDDGAVTRVSKTSTHHLTELITYTNELETFGFQIDNIYGDYDKTDFTNNSPYLILSATQR